MTEPVPVVDTPPVPPDVRTITAVPGGRLDALLQQRDAAKTEADKAKAALSAIEDGIKYELGRSLEEGETKIKVTGSGLARALQLAYVPRWEFNVKRLKAEHPRTYVEYAERNGSWKLTEVGSKVGGR